MTGASFAQFFPTASRAAKDRAMERERARGRTVESPIPQAGSTGHLASSHNDSAIFENTTLPSATTAARSSPAFPPAPSKSNGVSKASTSAAPNYGALNGCTPSPLNSNTLASSKGSSHPQKYPAYLPQTAQLTPPTSEESPAHSTSAARPTDQNFDMSAVPPTQTPNGTLPTPSTVERAPLRNPLLKSRGSKCVYDPLLDHKLSSSQQRKIKPIYKDISLDDDGAPPPDPRLAKGGRLNYINVDFHLPRSRLRHAPYVLRRYPYDPKTSVGPGPPTQIVVMGFNPLTTFSKIVAAFSAFGEIAESSNKMHPDNGSYLGFATFRYKNSTPSMSHPIAVSAIDAARRALRAMNGQRIESKAIRVEYDPDGRRSGRMLESILKKDAVKMARQTVITAPIVPPSSRPASRGSNVPPGPPPTAPRAPAAQRSVSRSGPQRPQAPEETSLEEQLKDRPYIFISTAHVPYMQSIVPHMKKRLRGFPFEDIRADRTGYFIVFPVSLLGRSEAERCNTNCHRTEFFNYTLHMKLSLGSSLLGSPITPRKRHPSRSPERPRPFVDPRRTEYERRRREDENDLDEEKRQRAKDFDPVKEAVERISREMRTQLIKRIQTHLSAPTIHKFLDPANPELAQVKRKHNIADFTNAPSIGIDSEAETPPNATPNSRADPSERRTGRLDITALPRIRKAIKTEGNTKRNKATGGASRRRGGRAFRSLHYRLPDLNDSEPESEDGSARVVSARDTEEPDSAPRSRMSPEADTFRDDWGQPDEDLMTEVSFPVTEPIAPPSRKRKLDMYPETIKKRLKKSDEELFGVTIERIDTESPRREQTEDIVIPDTADVTPSVATDRDSQTPAPEVPSKFKKKSAKSKKKSKKQIFKERKALKRQEEEQEAREKEAAAAAVVAETPTPSDDIRDKPRQSTPRKSAKPEKFIAKLNSGRFSIAPDTVADLPIDPKLSLSNISTVKVSFNDLPDASKLQRCPRSSGIKDPALWLWNQNRVRAMNLPSGAKTDPLKIDGYYVASSTGSARTDGIQKILNSEKSKYLPHHLKVQQARKEREATARVGKDTDIKKEIGKIVPKNNSRANRANNRRVAAELNDQKKAFGETSDVLRFNQLKKRKKPVKFDRSAIHNWGLFTLENIPKDDMIIEYVGEKVRQQISEIREQRYLKSGLGSSYLFRIDDNWVIDATKKGGIARFINHSCQPNCKANIIRVEGTKRIVIYALRDIAMNEELTYDYKFEREIGAVDRIPCLCGTAACKGFLN
ncbi:SET domain-containing protein [Zalerion maritima]|uniref:Histone-lysine N-methyltransferase, H3 lysine-4 specific n=1 Tax=Zalerion maritima TaxID=339359 RepID=A0AAD5WWL7_9PEZI|nr:SET domain-containing protein [Zalerion maritima]